MCRHIIDTAKLEFVQGRVTVEERRQLYSDDEARARYTVFPSSQPACTLRRISQHDVTHRHYKLAQPQCP